MRKFFRDVDKNSFKRVCAVIIATVVNVFIAFLTYTSGMPLYLDTIGTIGVTVIGGPYPGIVTAVLSSMISGAFNPNALFYSFVGILIAFVTFIHVREERFHNKKYFGLYVIQLALIGGFIGMIFQWLLLGAPQFDNISEVSKRIVGSDRGFLYFLTAAIINIALNLIDKGICVGVAFAVAHFVPQEIRESIRNSGWKQKPLTLKQIREFNSNSHKKGKSIDKRMAFLLVLATMSMAFITAFVGVSIYFINLKSEYSGNVSNAAVFATKTIDADNVDVYLSSRRDMNKYKDESYVNMKMLLSAFIDSSSYIDTLYICKGNKDGLRVIVSTDANIYDNYEIGQILPYEEIDKEYIEKLSKNEAVDTVIIEPILFGFHYKAYKPIYDQNSYIKAYAVSETHMSYLEGYMRDFMLKAVLVFSAFTILIIAAGMWVSEYNLIYPINSITANTYNLAQGTEDQKTLDDNVKKLRALDIHTEDDIQELYDAICKMAADMAEQMRDLRHYTEATVQMQNGLIITMADMVENRDSDTGAHIQKTAEYVKIILNGLKEKGYYSSKITPEYIISVVMSAPLHDVGKINIPDAVLNKPGKLTDEEYEIMKSHTTAGRHIIEKAINTVQGGSYLKEARNMAAYHHERWDGKGYPDGLHGEVIPLSARVMAVADVFDALASPRVYKKAFTIEETIKIISDGAGTQFDPKCVEVFLDHIEEVKRIQRKYQEG